MAARRRAVGSMAARSSAGTGPGGVRHSLTGASQLGRYLLVMCVAFGVCTAFWMVPTAGRVLNTVDDLKEIHKEIKGALAAEAASGAAVTCASPPCLPAPAPAAQPALDLSAARGAAGAGSGPTGAVGTGSGPTFISPASQPAPAPAPAVLPASQPAPLPAAAPATAAAGAQALLVPVAAPAFTPTTVGTGGINIVNSNPIAISNPINIKTPNTNANLNKAHAKSVGLGLPTLGGHGLLGGKDGALTGLVTDVLGDLIG